MMKLDSIEHINCKNLSFSYKKDKVLNNISFSMEAGDMIGILGPNGSGKTTLIKILDKILHPQQGEINLKDVVFKDISIRELAKKIGYIPQFETFEYTTTVFNTILLGRKPHFTYAPTKQDINITSEIIAKLGLASITTRKMIELSGGQRQKVLFGRLLAQCTEILLLDEPTANLDLKHQLEILNLLKIESRERGKVVLIAIHDINMALKFCNKFILLFDGEIVCSGGSDIITEEMIAKVYDVQVKIIKSEGQLIIVPKSSIGEKE